MRTPDGREVDPLEEALPEGTVLFRVHQNRFSADEYHPGPATSRVSTRFAFFGSPTVPVLYAAETPAAAISETLLHDVPIEGGRVDVDLVQSRILSQVVTTRTLRLLALHGHGFRRIGTEADRVTRTLPSRYADSMPWARAAHEAGFDGLVWMSRHHDTSRAYALFGRGGGHSDVQAVPGPGAVKVFAVMSHLDWLTALLDPLNVTIADPL